MSATDEKVRILFCWEVDEEGRVHLPEVEEMGAQLRPGGIYAMVPLADVQDRRVVEPVRRLFHLGELRGITVEDAHALAAAGFRTSDDVRAAGSVGLKRVGGLSEGAIRRVLDGFARLGIDVPLREGPTRWVPCSLTRRELYEEYAAHAQVRAVRALMAARYSGVESTFARSNAGFDIVCGSCDAQFVGVSEQDAAGLICDRCGRDCGLDLHIVSAQKRAAYIQPPAEDG